MSELAAIHPVRLKIDFVSDVVCPWCVIGLNSLEQAMQRLGDAVQCDVTLRAFELNPHMAREGQDIAEHLREKYGSTPEQSAQARDMIRQRGADQGFTFNMQKRDRIYNSFDAHRLLHWAASEHKQLELKHALFVAYFSEGRNISDHAVLLDIIQSVGLNRERASAILSSDEYAAEVRAEEQHFVGMGIHAVPSAIINDRYLIQGGQPTEAFIQALKNISQEATA